MFNFFSQKALKRGARKGFDSQSVQVRKVLSQFDQRLILAVKAA